MRDIEIDRDGELHCWNCGGTNFDAKRTTRAKLAVGIGALVTKKKLYCIGCGKYNQVGNAQPYEGPSQRPSGRTRPNRSPGGSSGNSTGFGPTT